MSRPDEDGSGKLPPDSVQRAQEDLIYGIGYRRPPEDTRFKKGQSGNPKGRPKRRQAEVPVAPPPIHRIILEEARRLVTVRDGTRTYEITTERAIIRATNNAAMKGNSHAQRLSKESISAAERDEQIEIAKSQAVWSEYKRVAKRRSKKRRSGMKCRLNCCRILRISSSNQVSRSSSPDRSTRSNS